MTTQPITAGWHKENPYSREASNLYVEAIVAGLIGAATIALWFLILDTLNGRPLFTPSVLGAALFRAHDGIADLGALPISLEMTLMYTWVHLLTFIVIGGIVARLLKSAEKNPNLGFGILLMFVFLELGFIAAAFMFAEAVLHALAWPAVLLGNLLAAATMAAYFWWHHPNLAIEP